MMKKKTRDTQRKKAYMAGAAWVALLKSGGMRRQFIEWAHMEAYAETVYLWVRANRDTLGIPRHVALSPPKLEYKARGRWSWAHAGGRIEVASSAKQRHYHWTDHLLLHEMAHIWTPGDGHGREWAAMFIKLVERWMGKDAGRELRREFRKAGVKFTPKRVLSPERKAELAERMRAMRAGALAERTIEESTWGHN
jgi:hypothetical protein